MLNEPDPLVERPLPPARHARGWPMERILHLLAGTVVLATLALGELHSPFWRIITGLVGANLLLDVVAGWCPASLLLRRLGVCTSAECALRPATTVSAG